jgi:hypothetical protein
MTQGDDPREGQPNSGEAVEQIETGEQGTRGGGQADDLVQPWLIMAGLADNAETSEGGTETVATFETETVATFEHDGATYEIDHLGIGHPDTQWGDFAVYRDGEQVGEFSVDASWFKEGHRPPLPDVDELIALAKATPGFAEHGGKKEAVEAVIGDLAAVEGTIAWIPVDPAKSGDLIEPWLRAMYAMVEERQQSGADGEQPKVIIVHDETAGLFAAAGSTGGTTTMSELMEQIGQLARSRDSRRWEELRRQETARWNTQKPSPDDFDLADAFGVTSLYREHDFTKPPVLMIQTGPEPDRELPAFPYYLNEDGSVAHQGHWRGRPDRLLGLAYDRDVHEVDMDAEAFLETPEHGEGTFPVFQQCDDTIAQGQAELVTVLATGIPAAHRRGQAIYDEATGTVTISAYDSDQRIKLRHDDLPANLANTLAEHGWTLVCDQATTPFWMPAGDGRAIAAVASYTVPPEWLEQRDTWLATYGDHQSVVRAVGAGRDSRIRYLILKPGDIVEADAGVLEIPDPNTTLFRQARIAMRKAGLRANRTGQAYSCTFAEMVNPDLITVPEASPMDDMFRMVNSTDSVPSTWSTTPPPTHRYAGSNKARQEVGLPGHCEKCARVGHVTAHPNLGCGDVGCTSGHSPGDPADLDEERSNR